MRRRYDRVCVWHNAVLDVTTRRFSCVKLRVLLLRRSMPLHELVSYVGEQPCSTSRSVPDKECEIDGLRGKFGCEANVSTHAAPPTRFVCWRTAKAAQSTQSDQSVWCSPRWACIPLSPNVRFEMELLRQSKQLHRLALSAGEWPRPLSPASPPSLYGARQIEFELHCLRYELCVGAAASVHAVASSRFVYWRTARDAPRRSSIRHSGCVVGRQVMLNIKSFST